MEFLLYVTPVAIIIIAIIFIINKGKKFSRWSNSLHEEQKTVTATLIKKEEITTAHSNGLRRNPGSIPFSSTTGRLTFETSAGEKLTFAVKGFDYGGVKEGEKGELTYQGIYYLSFKKSAEL
ncbi:MAG: DUF2500 domain-containing protein [Clostridia bacterium]|nr:DUF2500 domain-containing protein [Clostridia bacterium]